ncbi:MAG: hypothetical protein ACYCWE_03785 [Eubacteriales bacterium]
MTIDIKEYLNGKLKDNNIPAEKLLLPDIGLDTGAIKVIMINEVAPQNPDDWFYSKTENPNFMTSTLSLFRNAGVDVNCIEDIINLGIYITTAVKSPKTGYTVDTDIIKSQLPLLEAELALFPNLKVIMLMGDVAKKAVNMIVKAGTKKNVIPAEATYKIRDREFYWNDIRVIPSYIMTGGNILIEKGKCDVISDDIKKMMRLI